jgi:uncharacterized protein YbbC (DUF1343 family)
MRRGLAHFFLLMFVAACRSSTAPVTPLAVTPGLEVLVTDSVALVRGRRVGLVTNQAGVARSGMRGRSPVAGRSTPDRDPESRHGFRVAAAPSEHVTSSRDSATGLPIYSLYGATRADARDAG